MPLADVKTEVYNSDYISSVVTKEGRGEVGMDKLAMSNVGEVRVGKRIGFSLCAAPLHQYCFLYFRGSERGKVGAR